MNMAHSHRSFRRCWFAVWALPCVVHAVTVTLDPGQRFQTMDGFGASAAFYENWLTAYPAAAKQQIYDVLFRDSGMSILRVRVYPDLWPSSTGALSWSWTTHQREIIEAARSRGVTTVWATCWSPPAWMKDNGSLNGGNLRTDRYDAYAVFITSYVVGMRDLYGIPIAGVSIFNEPGFGTSYDSTLTSPTAYRDVLKHIGAYAAARQAPITFFCCDTMDINNTTWGALGRGYVPTLLADTTAAALTDRIITHQYGSIDADRWHDLKTLAHTHGKTVWESEMAKLSGATHDIEEALEISRWMWIAITSGDAAAWHYWQYFWPYAAGAAEGLIDIYNPWSGDGASGRFTVPKRYHAMRQWSQHVRPGYVRIGCASDDARVLAAAFTGTSTTVAVLMNRSTEALPVLVRGFNGSGAVQYARTTATEDYAMQQPVLSSAGAFTAVIPGKSIATFSVNTDTSVPANLPPSVTLTSPVHGSSFTAPATVNLAATASDIDGSIARVEFWTGATRLNADTASPYAYSWAGVAAGSYPLRAIAYDNQNATSTSTVVDITVYSSGTPPNQPPVVSLTGPVTGSTYTAPATVNLAATASDADGSIAAVRFYSGTTLLNLDTTSPYTYTWTGVSSGTYQLYATATDNQGAVSTSAVASVTVYPPNQPPTVTMTSPVNNSTYTAPATIQLTASATDPDGSIAHVRFYRGSTLLNTDSASPYEYTWTNVSSGTYQLRAVAQDNQGATSTSTIITVTVLSSSTPAVWYTLTATANPANGGTVSPASGTYLAGSQIQVTATPNANYTFATWSGDATGTNPTITLTMDSNKTLTANFTDTPPVNSSPSVTITSPADGATFTAPASITITATATDSDGSIAAVRFYSGTTLLNTDSASPYSYSWTGVAAGTYVLTAQAEDNGGAVGISPAVTVTVNPGTQQPQPVLEPGEVRVIGGQDGYINATTNPNVTIRFRRTTAGMVTVKIYDLRGRLVAEKVKDGQAGIDDDVAWNAADLSAGVYLIVTKGGGIEQTQRSAVIR
jgi:uncharacterized repeat protein (TIGR02543 family)